MAALLALVLFAQPPLPSLAPYIPKMKAPVVNVKATRTMYATSAPWVGQLVPRRTSEAIGSGVIINRSRRLVLTNQHIVERAATVRVQLADDHEREYDAEVIGSDKDLDIAVLRIKTKDRLPAAKLGRSNRLRVGDYVVAVGNPYGLHHTVTSGIVSARSRRLDVGPKAPLLQTDASINPGNSGGPLYTLDGRVVGINTAIVAGSSGIGFAVPIDVIRRALPQLERDGKISRGFAGVRVMPVSRAAADALNTPSRSGALVRAVVPGSPGEDAGLRPGDVIVAWDDYEVETADTLPWLVALTPPGSDVDVKLVRAGMLTTTRVHVGEERPDLPGP